MAAASNTPGSRAGGSVIDLMWQKTALLFMLYLLARSLMPSVLPRIMTDPSWFDPKLVFMCAIPGAIWAGLSLLTRRREAAAAGMTGAAQERELNMNRKTLRRGVSGCVAVIALSLSLSLSCGGASKEMKMAVKEERPDGTRVFAVFWEPGFGTPSESGEALLLMDDGTTCTTPPGYPSSIKSDNKQTGKQLCIRMFLAPKVGNPTAVQIAGSKRSVRWSTEEEGRSLLDEMNPGPRTFR